MTDPRDDGDDGARDRLRTVSGSLRGMRWVAAGGAAVLLAALALVFGAPSPAWFLLYPLLVMVGMAALVTAVAWLLRYL